MWCGGICFGIVGIVFFFCVWINWGGFGGGSGDDLGLKAMF